MSARTSLNAPAARGWRGMRVGLLTKVMIATLLASFAPLALVSYNALDSSRTASDQATAAATDGLDTQELRAIQQRTAQTVEQISSLLNTAVQDTKALALVPRTPDAFLSFYNFYSAQIHYPAGTTNAPEVKSALFPLYPEVAYIDATGRERIRILQGQITPPDKLRDVSVPANTTYKTETYFTETRSLMPGEFYVSHLLAWHMSTPLQPASSAEFASMPAGSAFSKYKGVLRFATPATDSSGRFDGMVMLTLDARHIMELAVHILPASEETWTPWPDFLSGNYAYMFDDEGYVIEHPVLDEVRGVDTKGNPVSPAKADMPAEQQAKLPSYMPNTPNGDLYQQVLAQKSGVAIKTSADKIPLASVYAPIPFTLGSYSKTKVFGGLVIGAAVPNFHKAANAVRASIDSQRSNLQTATLLIAGAAVVLLVLISVLVARTIVNPVSRLTLAARRMEENELDSPLVDSVANRPFPDEVSKLAQVFKSMAIQVQLRERQLKERINELNIQLDQQKKEQQVAEITETDYFRNLQQQAQRLRSSRRPGAGSAQATPDGPNQAETGVNR